MQGVVLANLLVCTEGTPTALPPTPARPAVWCCQPSVWMAIWTLTTGPPDLGAGLGLDDNTAKVSIVDMVKLALQKRVKGTVLGSGCPDCAAVRSGGIQKRHPTLTERQHEMLQFWDWGLNEKAGLDPDKLRCRSGKTAHWICHKCPVGQSHEWQAPVTRMYECVSRGTLGCPCCEGRQACKCNSLQSLFPEVAAEWDYERNNGTPAEYAAQSSKKVWWCTNRRGHLKAAIQGRTQAWTSKQQASQASCILAHVMEAQCGRPALASPSVYAHAWQPSHADSARCAWQFLA